MMKTALQRAIDSAGSLRVFAAQLEISEQSVCRWKNKYKGNVPSGRVLKVYEISGVTPHELRPDLYPNPTDGLPPDHQSTPAGA
ncbi:transcriptional regulator [Mixta mediterraneensis]|uniref:transcriptional regulator n=1 Tax=Mixta mediterraneensis TaxID=2758443 RepID=UPI003AFF92D5